MKNKKNYLIIIMMMIATYIFSDQAVSIAGTITDNRLSCENITVGIQEGNYTETTITDENGHYNTSVGTVPVIVMPMSDSITFSPEQQEVNSQTNNCNFQIADAQLSFEGNFLVENSDYSNFTVKLSINTINGTQIIRTTSMTPGGHFSLPYNLNEVREAYQYTIEITNPDYFPQSSNGNLSENLTLHNDLENSINFQISNLRPNLVTVSQTNSNATYTSLSEAIDDVRPNGTVYISGDYTLIGAEGNISFNKNIKIKGVGNNTKIISPNAKVFDLSSPEITDETVISNLIFTDCSTNTYSAYGGAIKITGGAHPVISNCTFSNCVASISYETNFTGGAGGAIYIDNPSENPLKIQSCMFDSCSVFDLDGGGAIAYKGLGKLQIDDCDFEKNIICEWTGNGGSNGALIGNAILYDGNYNSSTEANLEITNSKFYANYESNYLYDSRFIAIRNPSTSGSIVLRNNSFDGMQGISCNDKHGAINIVFENNIYQNASLAFAVYYNGGSTTPTNYDYISINNNTFINLDTAVYLSDSPEYTLKNNIFEDCGTAISWNNGPYNGLILKNNLFYNNTTNYWSGSSQHPLTSEGNIEADPQLDENCVPIWTATAKSPCIDAGYRWDEFEGDNTRKDIGAKYNVHQDGYDVRCFYDEDPEFPDNNRGDYINWVCFPVIDKILNNADLATTVLGEPGLLNITPQKLEYLEWKEYHDEHEQGNRKIYYDENSDWYNENHQINYADGYKLKLVPHSGNFHYELSGQLAPEDTEINLAHGWNWIGYFLKESQDPMDALSPVLDKISQIKHHDWALSKAVNKWIGPSNYTINYGDMIMVYCDQPVSFVYGGNGITPIKKSGSSLFTYTEQTDYTPIYVDMNSSSKSYQEIAIFVDGACYGASVVDADTVQINAYIQNIDPNENHNIQFVIRNDNKSAAKYVNKYAVMNNKTGKFTCRDLDLSKGSDYYFVSFKDKPDNSENVTPLKTTLKNYPNPFKVSGNSRNTGTTISFTIPESGNVKLKVYNIKGQLVKNIINGKQEAGEHKIIWNGTNKNNEVVASGIYFYRLETKNKTIYKKMLMIK